ncbi:hypothetical protein [Chitinimonas lacunae]|uniref:Copper resistance protein CopC n=1 Tax=Chitinimonas lacunae TaxID=1963018 RepID=A0ABV8MQU2_9NEIS
MTPLIRQAMLLWLLLLSPAVFAHGDEDHGDGAARAPAGQGLPPRAEAQSESFELLLELSGEELTLYLDRFADNQPVRGARIEVEGKGFKGVARSEGDHYRLSAGALAQPGEHSLIFTITAGDSADLLETTLRVEGDGPTRQSGQARDWRWLLAGLLVLVVLIIVLRTLLRRKKS